MHGHFCNSGGHERWDELGVHCLVVFKGHNGERAMPLCVTPPRTVARAEERRCGKELERVWCREHSCAGSSTGQALCVGWHVVTIGGISAKVG